MKNKLILVVFVIGFVLKVNGQDYYKYYIGTNPVSYALSLPLKEELKRYTPVMAGNEYGLSLAGAYFINRRISLETRAAIGKIHQIASVKQFHAGIMIYPFLRQNSDKALPLYAGAFAKTWDYHNQLTGIHFYNLSPYAVIGYQLGRKRLFADFRINQTLAIVSWTNLKDTSHGASAFFSPWPELIKVLPTISCTIGYRFYTQKTN